ncbi:MAG: S41 family peptidase [Gammaproteobacteria bacterium]
MQNTRAKLIFVPLFLLQAMTFVACGGSGDGNAVVSRTTQEKLQGTWEQRGYGRALQIASTSVTYYDFTSETCVRGETESLGEFAVALNDIAQDEDEFQLRDTALGFSERYSRIGSLPTTCGQPISAQPTEIFHHVWHTFQELYAFFPERDVDWLAQYDAVRDDVHDGMSDAELFAALQTLVGPIDDVHVSISTPDGNVFSPGQPKGFYLDLLAEFAEQSDVPTPGQYFDQELSKALAIIDDVYLDEEYRQAGGPTGDFFKWGLIGERTGYLSIGAFILQFDRTIADQLLDVEEVMDQALTDLADTEALIVDVRLSPGGADPIALAIAQRFVDARRLAMRKITRTSEGESSGQDLFVAPSTRVQYDNPVVILTSGYSASATEVFTLAMRALPHVTVVGEPTIGALSDVLEKTLPNGWQIGLANEVYFDADGFSYEATGIPPDVSVPAFAKQERDIGQDSAINAALTALGIDLQ